MGARSAVDQFVGGAVDVSQAKPGRVRELLQYSRPCSQHSPFLDRSIDSQTQGVLYDCRRLADPMLRKITMVEDDRLECDTLHKRCNGAEAFGTPLQISQLVWVRPET